jgi:hypothetical protein
VARPVPSQLPGVLPARAPPPLTPVILSRTNARTSELQRVQSAPGTWAAAALSSFLCALSRPPRMEPLRGVAGARAG